MWVIVAGAKRLITKLLLFIAGTLVGAGVILAANRTTGPDDITPQPTVEQQAATVVSPLAVVNENTDGTTDVGPAVSTTLLQPLINRIELAEARISELELALASVGARSEAVTQPPPVPEVTSADELLGAGFDPFTVEEIQNIRNEVQLQRLDLRDLATREGWVNTDRFRESIRELNRDDRLRQSLGDENYDKLLLAEGRNNRVRIESIIANSAAETAGVVSGDILLRYADDRIFTFGDLRSATTSGQRDEPVSIQVLRNGEAIDFVVPRGPLGVTISGISSE